MQKEIPKAALIHYVEARMSGEGTKRIAQNLNEVLKEI